KIDNRQGPCVFTHTSSNFYILHCENSLVGSVASTDHEAWQRNSRKRQRRAAVQTFLHGKLRSREVHSSPTLLFPITSPILLIQSRTIPRTRTRAPRLPRG